VGGNSPYRIDGMDTDVSQIALSLMHCVRELYPINKIPEKIALQLENLLKTCKECEEEIQETINLISEQRRRAKI